MDSVLLVASEYGRFVKTGGLADMVAGLAPALGRLGHRVDVVLPCYAAVRELAYAEGQPVDRFEVLLGRRSYRVAVRALQDPSVRVLLVDIPELFDRPGFYGESVRDYDDNAVRFGVFCRAALQLASRVCRPRVIHCHDWQTGLLPAMLRSSQAAEPSLAGVRTVFTVHNLAYQGLFDRSVLAPLDLDPSLFQPEGLEFHGRVGFLKAGLVYGDLLTTVSRGYAEEILTPAGGCGLDGVLRARRSRLFGILNGFEVGDPSTDPDLARPFSAEDLSGKGECKRALLGDLGLPVEPSAPLLAWVGRLVEQKGFDLVTALIEFLVSDGLRLVVLGTGDPSAQASVADAARRHPRSVAVRLAVDEPLKRRILAGADMLLMPSRFEPCGYHQVSALGYGTVPIVRRTGGLADTVTAETGFTFEAADVPSFQDAVARAVRVYRERPGRWRELMRAGMRQDFSWDRAAREYSRLYASLAGLD